MGSIQCISVRRLDDRVAVTAPYAIRLCGGEEEEGIGGIHGVPVWRAGMNYIAREALNPLLPAARGRVSCSVYAQTKCTVASLIAVVVVVFMTLRHAGNTTRNALPAPSVERISSVA